MYSGSIALYYDLEKFIKVLKQFRKGYTLTDVYEEGPKTKDGRDGRSFKMYRFRSMYMDAEQKLEELLQKNEMDGPAFKIKDDPRITRVGHFIRKTNIDELPQLWNIFKDDMSIVGPRPALPREVEQYKNI